MSTRDELVSPGETFRPARPVDIIGCPGSIGTGRPHAEREDYTAAESQAET